MTQFQMPLPATPDAWLNEIAAAYHDAAGAISFAPMAGNSVSEDDLFQIAPEVCLKFRGIQPTKANRDRATNAALSSYVVTIEMEGGFSGIPQAAFAFCYIASHFGLGLIGREDASEIMDHVNANIMLLKGKTERCS